MRLGFSEQHGSRVGSRRAESLRARSGAQCIVRAQRVGVLRRRSADEARPVLLHERGTVTVLRREHFLFQSR